MTPRSILGQILVSAASGVSLFIGLWTAGAIIWLYSASLHDLEAAADQESRELAAALAPLVWNLDDRSINAYLDTKTESPEFISIVVKENLGGRSWSSPADMGASRGQATVERILDIQFTGKQIGTVKVGMTIKPRQIAVTGTIAALVVSQILLFLAVVAAVALSWRVVARRLHEMVVVMEDFSHHKGSTRMIPGREDELGILSRGFNVMADRIQATTQSMEKEIQERTDRLIESEKLALVGSLVAGVAHEINTPVGNGITITSWLAKRTKEVKQLKADGNLTEEDFNLFFEDVEGSLGILESGLDRTSNLIQTFKKIGTDQVVDERRALPMAEFLEEVTVSLHPTLKRFPHEVVINTEPNLVIESHPGALYQIVTNLILNAHIHAFGPDEAGTITIGAAQNPADPESVTLTVKDNGAGMSPEVQAQAFLPFFTTKRHEGGTGLGLSIVRSLVLNLGGAIEVRTALGKGTEFLIVLPKRSPDKPPVPGRSETV